MEGGTEEKEMITSRKIDIRAPVYYMDDQKIVS